MAITNIIDNRVNVYCSTQIKAIIEPSCHNNDQLDAEQHSPDDPKISTYFEELNETSVVKAIEWANQFEFPVTLFLYDYEKLEQLRLRGAEFMNLLRKMIDEDKTQNS